MDGSKKYRRILRKGGWYPGRRANLKAWHSRPTKPFAAVRAVLSEFGGLVLGKCGAGIDMARSDVDFTAKPYYESFDREAWIDEDVGKQVYPLAEWHHGIGELWIDIDGGLYAVGDFPEHEQVRYWGQCLDVVLEALLLGKKCPDQKRPDRTTD